MKLETSSLNERNSRPKNLLCDVGKRQPEPLFFNFTPLRRAKQRLMALTSRTALLRGKMAAPGEDATTKRSRRVVPREVSEILARKFYQVFDLLKVDFARADERSRMRGSDVREVA